MREDGFQCRQCGQCCIHVSGAFSACATEADIARWEAAGRDDMTTFCPSCGMPMKKAPGT